MTHNSPSPSLSSCFQLLPILGCLAFPACKAPKPSTRHITFAEPAAGIAEGPRPHLQGAAWCLNYEPDTVEIAGTLQRLTYPGRPNYESIAEGDEPETGFYLILTKPVCTRGDSLSSDAYPIERVDTVQLVLDSAGYAQLRPSLGQNLSLSGTLFPAQTGHHHAPLLLQVLGQY